MDGGYGEDPVLDKDTILSISNELIGLDQKESSINILSSTSQEAIKDAIEMVKFGIPRNYVSLPGDIVSIVIQDAELDVEKKANLVANMLQKINSHQSDLKQYVAEKIIVELWSVHSSNPENSIFSENTIRFPLSLFVGIVIKQFGEIEIDSLDPLESLRIHQALTAANGINALFSG